jgi:exodeoxyribonuclease V beta subunit
VHRAKGLQYPVVWCPFLSEGPRRRRMPTPRGITIPDDGRRRVDLGLGEDPERRHVQGLGRLESWREEIRLLYVALTRAQHLAVVHTGAFKDGGLSPLARVLYGVEVTVDDRGRLQPDPDVSSWPDERLRASLADDDLVVEQLGAPDTATEPTRGPHAVATAIGRTAGAGALEARSLTRTLDRTWQRTSFSRLVRGRKPTEDDDGRDVDDVAEVDDLDGASAGRVAGDAEVPLAAMPRGPAVGTFVHAVLEELDFPQAVVPGYVRGVVERHLRRSGVTGIDVDGWSRRSAGWSPPRSAAASGTSGWSTSLGRTGATSSASTCRWPVVTARSARR